MAGREFKSFKFKTAFKFSNLNGLKRALKRFTGRYWFPDTGNQFCYVRRRFWSIRLEFSLADISHEPRRRNDSDLEP